MEMLFIKILLVAVLLTAFFLVKKQRLFFNSPAMILRRRLRQKMRFHGSPMLCSKHSESLKLGQMARLDKVRCEVCKGE